MFATGAEQSITLPVTVALGDLLIFENGMEQNGKDFSLVDDTLTFTRPTGNEIVVKLVGGYRGKGLEPDARGSLADRSNFDGEADGFSYLDIDNAEFYFKAASGWNGPFGLKGADGADGSDGQDGVSPVLDHASVAAALGFTPADKAGDTFTGPVEISGPAGSVNRVFRVSTGLTVRWAYGADGTAEDGTNAGSNFVIARFDDAGLFLDAPLVLNRKSRALELLALPSVGGDKLGYLGAPARYVTASTTLTQADAGKMVTATTNPGGVFSIPSDAFDEGTIISIANTGGGAWTIVPAAGVNLYWNGTGLVGTRTIANASLATVTCIAGVWIISGGGLS